MLDLSVAFLYCAFSPITQDHRRKGLSKAVVRRLLQVSYYRSPAFAYIEANNSASQDLFRSLGFVRCCDAVWVGVRVL